MFFLVKTMKRFFSDMRSRNKKGCIILLGGKAGSGKDLVADYLVDFVGFTKLAFADALKDFVSRKYNVDKKLMYSQDGKKTKVVFRGKLISVRDLLIKVASQKRKYNEDLWVDVIIKRIKKEIVNNKSGNPLKIVISDFRFINEYNKIYENFYGCLDIHTIKIQRNKAEKIDDPSETSLDSFRFDHTISNNSTKAKLFRDVERELLVINKN